jgi:hypothetical protein
VRVPAISLIDALDDSDLFAPLFRGSSWRPWRVFLAALFGVPLDDEARALYRHHTERTAAPQQPFRETALVSGRRGGKSRVLALVAVFLACFRDYSVYLAPGEQPVIAIIAANRQQARVLLRYVVGLLRAVPMLADLIEGEPLAESVTLVNGVVIEIHTGNIGSPRGRTFVAVLADEIAFWPSADEAVNADSEVIASVRPGLVSIPGSLLMMASSPYARRGVLWQTYRRYFGKDDGRVLVWKGTTLEMNATIPAEEISDAYEQDPESARAEYGAEFRTDVADFVDRSVVEAAVQPGCHEQSRLAGIHYAAFTDPSGGSSDSMSLAIAHGTHDGRGILDCVREIKPPFSPESVVVEFAQIIKSYGCREVTGDRYAGEWPRERFREHGIEYKTSEKSKSDIYRELLPPLNSGKLELLDHQRLVTQLCSLERRVGRGTGKDSIDHPPGSHDDVANAAAGALVAVVGEGSVAGMLQMWRTLGGAPEPQREVAGIVVQSAPPPPPRPEGLIGAGFGRVIRFRGTG